MKKILSLLLAITITSTNTTIAYENSAPSTWQQIKNYENALERQMHGFVIQTDWNTYHNNRRHKESLFNALVYAENTCTDASNTAQQKKECENVLLRPLVIAYIETALNHDKDKLSEYFAPENQQIYHEYINFLKEQKENYRIKPMQRALKDC